jgi:hypothetical protein
VVHAYSINQETFKRNKNFYFDLLAMTSLTKDDVVKYELKVNIADTDIYVAPRFEAEMGTYWVPTKDSGSNKEDEMKRIFWIQDMSV